MQMQKMVYPPLYYQWAIKVLSPLYRFWMYTRKHRLPHYQREIDERFGRSKTVRPKSTSGRIIWCHAVSLGELNTVYPLLCELLDDGHGLYITSTTQTGFARVSVLFEHQMMTGQVVQGFVPVDDVAVVGKFVRRLCPSVALFVETELWANTLAVLTNNGVPSVMVNARLVDSSRAGYGRFKKLSQSMMANLSLVLAQDERSAQNFLALGLSPDKLKIVNSLKWSQSFAVPSVDVPVKRPMVWTAGSTHKGEESLCLKVHKQILNDNPNALLILVPRHPERFDEVYGLCLAEGVKVARRSWGEAVGDCQVYLADTMGELLYWYDVCDVAVVGGSFVAVGGHNPIEPASLAKPVIMGRYAHACRALLDVLVEAGAGVQLGDETDVMGLYQAVMGYRGEQGKIAGQNGYKVSQTKSQAVLEQKAYLSPYLSTTRSPAKPDEM